jgi:hypothetical protein
LPAGVGVSDAVWRTAVPAVNDAEFAERQRALRGALADVQSTVLAL